MFKVKSALTKVCVTKAKKIVRVSHTVLRNVIKVTIKHVLILLRCVFTDMCQFCCCNNMTLLSRLTQNHGALLLLHEETHIRHHVAVQIAITP